MADDPSNLVLQHLRVIRDQLDIMSDRPLESAQRVGSLEARVANMSVRIDRIDARLDRFERRLGLVTWLGRSMESKNCT